jgi:hypothetical protein
VNVGSCAKCPDGSDGGVVGSTRIAGILVEVVTDEKVLRIPLRKQERESGKKPYERHSFKTGWNLRLTVEDVFE